MEDNKGKKKEAASSTAPGESSNDDQISAISGKRCHSFSSDEKASASSSKAAENHAQDKFKNTQVFVRLKPLARAVKNAKDSLYQVNGPQLFINLRDVPQDMSKNVNVLGKRFVYTDAFSAEASQLMVFDRAVKPLVEEFFNGDNCTVMCYGAAQSGKSYTLEGTPTNAGIISRSLKFMFSMKLLENSPIFRPRSSSAVEILSDAEFQACEDLKKRILSSFEKPKKSNKITPYDEVVEKFTGRSHVHTDSMEVWISFAEVREETYYDLLATDYLATHEPLQGDVDDDGNSFIEGLNYVFVSSEAEAHAILYFGKRNLHTFYDKRNTLSSRSHCIFSVVLLRYYEPDDPAKVHINRLTFCDLASQDSSDIDLSLVALTKSLKANHETQARTYQKSAEFLCLSTLTRLFASALIGDEHLTLITHINQDLAVYRENHAVLHFTALISETMTAVRKLNTYKPSTSFGVAAQAGSLKLIDCDHLTPTMLIELSGKFQSEIAALKARSLRGDMASCEKIVEKYVAMIERIDNDYKKKLNESAAQKSAIQQESKKVKTGHLAADENDSESHIEALSNILQRLRGQKQIMERELITERVQLAELIDGVRPEHKYIMLNDISELNRDVELSDARELIIRYKLALNQAQEEFRKLIAENQEKEKKIGEVERKYVAVKLDKNNDLLIRKIINWAFQRLMETTNRAEKKIVALKKKCDELQQLVRENPSNFDRLEREGSSGKGAELSMDVDEVTNSSEDRAMASVDCSNGDQTSSDVSSLNLSSSDGNAASSKVKALNCESENQLMDVLTDKIDSSYGETLSSQANTHSLGDKMIDFDIQTKEVDPTTVPMETQRNSQVENQSSADLGMKIACLERTTTVLEPPTIKSLANAAIKAIQCGLQRKNSCSAGGEVEITSSAGKVAGYNEKTDSFQLQTAKSPSSVKLDQNVNSELLGKLRKSPIICKNHRVTELFKEELTKLANTEVLTTKSNPIIVFTPKNHEAVQSKLNGSPELSPKDIQVLKNLQNHQNSTEKVLKNLDTSSIIDFLIQQSNISENAELLEAKNDAKPSSEIEQLIFDEVERIFIVQPTKMAAEQPELSELGQKITENSQNGGVGTKITDDIDLTSQSSDLPNRSDLDIDFPGQSTEKLTEIHGKCYSQDQNLAKSVKNQQNLRKMPKITEDLILHENRSVQFIKNKQNGYPGPKVTEKIPIQGHMPLRSASEQQNDVSVGNNCEKVKFEGQWDIKSRNNQEIKGSELKIHQINAQSQPAAEVRKNQPIKTSDAKVEPQNHLPWYPETILRKRIKITRTETNENVNQQDSAKLSKIQEITAAELPKCDQLAPSSGNNQPISIPTLKISAEADQVPADEIDPKISSEINDEDQTTDEVPSDFQTEIPVDEAESKIILGVPQKNNPSAEIITEIQAELGSSVLSVQEPIAGKNVLIISKVIEFPPIGAEEVIASSESADDGHPELLTKALRSWGTLKTSDGSRSPATCRTDNIDRIPEVFITCGIPGTFKVHGTPTTSRNCGSLSLSGVFESHVNSGKSETSLISRKSKNSQTTMSSATFVNSRISANAAISVNYTISGTHGNPINSEGARSDAYSRELMTNSILQKCLKTDASSAIPEHHLVMGLDTHKDYSSVIDGKHMCGQLEVITQYVRSADGTPEPPVEQPVCFSKLESLTKMPTDLQRTPEKSPIKRKNAEKLGDLMEKSKSIENLGEKTENSSKNLTGKPQSIDNFGKALENFENGKGNSENLKGNLENFDDLVENSENYDKNSTNLENLMQDLEYLVENSKDTENSAGELKNFANSGESLENSTENSGNFCGNSTNLKNLIGNVENFESFASNSATTSEISENSPKNSVQRVLKTVEEQITIKSRREISENPVNVRRSTRKRRLPQFLHIFTSSKRR